MGTSEGQRLLARPMRRWGDNIKMGLKEMVGMAWNGLLWIREPFGSVNCGEFNA
jgi:hypothetical protein